MKTREKLVLSLLALILILAGLSLIIISVPLLPFSFIVDYLELMGRSPLAGLLVAALLIVLALFFLVKGFKREKDSKYLSQAGSLGEFRVSFPTMENLVRSACSPRREIRNLKTKIDPREGSLNILMRMSVLPDTDIPALIEELQDSVKNYLEEMTGFEVGEVKIMVDTVSSEEKR